MFTVFFIFLKVINNEMGTDKSKEEGDIRLRLLQQ